MIPSGRLFRQASICESTVVSSSKFNFVLPTNREKWLLTAASHRPPKWGGDARRWDVRFAILCFLVALHVLYFYLEVWTLHNWKPIFQLDPNLGRWEGPFVVSRFVFGPTIIKKLNDPGYDPFVVIKPWELVTGYEGFTSYNSVTRDCTHLFRNSIEFHLRSKNPPFPNSSCSSCCKAMAP